MAERLRERECPFIEVQPLNNAQVREFINKSMALVSKSMTGPQIDQILANPCCHNPSFLTFLLDELVSSIKTHSMFAKRLQVNFFFLLRKMNVVQRKRGEERERDRKMRPLLGCRKINTRWEIAMKRKV